MEDIDVPAYFICPISLLIMKDPVTAITGITYDRESIEHWLLTADDASCPVTKQPLPRDSDLTPNHTLRRLIQAWCTANADLGIDRIPTPKSILSISDVLKLHRQLNSPQLYMHALKTMDVLVNENEKNRKCMAEAGSARAMVLLIVKCWKGNRNVGIEEAFRVLHLTWKPSLDNIEMVKENFDLIESILWILQADHKVDNTYVVVKHFAIFVLKAITEVASSSLLERLENKFFYVIVKMLRDYCTMFEQATKTVVHVLLNVVPWGRNRIKIVEANAVFELIELELGHPGKHVTELIICLLAGLCACADGRAQFLKHAGGIAFVSKRILRVSPVTDDRAVHILTSIARHSATEEVVVEMLNVGAVAKLCMVIQADCDDNLKKKARGILKLHNNAWSNSPCIADYLFTKFAGN
ncbi:RING-type E3 ubiquitin transferase [Heracleum sosnowskyi]|uniref:U-box domain-containing protein n=1 Tax=Heracleum sosnowskyi TaxID=360622 RepID=A0AAD8GSP4_9APIA|nr:RING-type E3 ubiquitin transferase [Heracleum sosnowskyi]